MPNEKQPLRTGWTAALTKLTLAALFFELVTGLVITFAPFHAAVEWSVIVHTVVGLVVLIPITWYFVAHFLDYWRYNLSDVLLLGYVAGVALVVCALSGLVVTWQGLFGIAMSPGWRNVHLYSTFVVLATTLPHFLLVWIRVRKSDEAPALGGLMAQTLGAAVIGLLLVGALTLVYSGETYVNEFPEDYSYIYGEDRPFAPSLARTATGGAFDPRSLAGSETCGSSGCHSQILEEWKPSAHRYSAMDVLFQGVQKVMAEQNGPESTRYCGGCHDPISLFSGSKNIYSEELTGAHGYQEGVSCLSCHGVRETDLQGNANYVMTQPSAYLWQWSESGLSQTARDFLIRTYPDEHNKLSKRMFKTPEYCAACHKQFIDQEVNRVGWVQLQNQYDNWKASHWYVEGDPERTIECRECHMPLVDSTDPASGDPADYNRTPDDGKHRSHRFIASNSLMPKMLELEGWEKQNELTEMWLQGRYEVPEIEHKWTKGPIINLALEVPEATAPGETMPIRVVLTSSKVGHDYPTGPLDIIQSWVEIQVVDDQGNVIFSSGTRDEKNFIEPGAFLFKAEPVDQYGNLIDRHNLWEMVGVRFRRAIFPGFADTVEYQVACPSSLALPPKRDRPVSDEETQDFEVPVPAEAGHYQVTAKLMYRKVDQYLLNFLLGEDSGVTAPAIEITRATASVEMKTGAQRTAMGAPSASNDDGRAAG